MNKKVQYGYPGKNGKFSDSIKQSVINLKSTLCNFYYVSLKSDPYLQVLLFEPKAIFNIFRETNTTVYYLSTELFISKVEADDPQIFLFLFGNNIDEKNLSEFYRQT